MEHFFEIIWKRCRNTIRGRFIAGLVIGLAFGVPASLSVSHDAVTVAIWSVGAGVIGGFAAIVLESRDRHRSATPEWQQPVEKTAVEIRSLHLQVPPHLAQKAATAHEQARFTPLVWVGISLGILCALCGVLVFIMKIVDLFRQ